MRFRIAILLVGLKVIRLTIRVYIDIVFRHFFYFLVILSFCTVWFFFFL